MNANEAKVGATVKSNRKFCCVPSGTRGRIVEDYGTGVMVEWDLPTDFKPIQDGFDKETELGYLDVVSP